MPKRLLPVIRAAAAMLKSRLRGPLLLLVNASDEIAAGVSCCWEGLEVTTGFSSCCFCLLGELVPEVLL